MMASVFYTLEREVINEKKLMKDIVRLVSAQNFPKTNISYPPPPDIHTCVCVSVGKK